MKVESLIEALHADFFTGVPDSQLKNFCNYLMSTYGVDGQHHIIAANEGNAVALAAGHYLVTGKPAVVYMQNSGIGNAVNPIASLLSDKVYGIPCIFLVGWRGEPGVYDEPQHVFQGEVTPKLFKDLDIATMILDTSTLNEAVVAQLNAWQSHLAAGKSVAFLVKKGAIEDCSKVSYRNENALCREEIIEAIVNIAQPEDIFVATTGKGSRELFELRAAKRQPHQSDFLTVGSMGHASSIALKIAVDKPDRRIWCIDGDGAALMHLGAMAIIGSNKPRNMVHIVINNEAHESVGGMPTVAGKVNLIKIAEGCGYLNVQRVKDKTALVAALQAIRQSEGLSFLEVKSALGSRSDLGRPTTTPKENKEAFMEFLGSR